MESSSHSITLATFAVQERYPLIVGNKARRQLSIMFANIFLPVEISKLGVSGRGGIAGLQHIEIPPRDRANGIPFVIL